MTMIDHECPKCGTRYSVSPEFCSDRICPKCKAKDVSKEIPEELYEAIFEGAAYGYFNVEFVIRNVINRDFIICSHVARHFHEIHRLRGTARQPQEQPWLGHTQYGLLTRIVDRITGKKQPQIANGAKFQSAIPVSSREEEKAWLQSHFVRLCPPYRALRIIFNFVFAIHTVMDANGEQSEVIFDVTRVYMPELR